MAAGTLRITGLREAVRALKEVDDGRVKTLREGLKKAAEPVTATAKAKISRYTGASVGTIGPRVRGTSVFVTQRAKKVTGQRGDFGALQYRKLSEALDEHEDDVFQAVEHALDDLVRSAGF